MKNTNEILNSMDYYLMNKNKHKICTFTKNIAIIKQYILLAGKGKTSMSDVKTLTNEELNTKCNKVYSKSELEESIVLAEKQVEKGLCRPFDKQFIDELRNRHIV